MEAFDGAHLERPPRSPPGLLPTAAKRPPRALVHTWPNLVRKEVLAAMAVALCLLALGALIDAPLDAPADPNAAPLELKAPWYFVGLQELLVYLEPWIVGGLLPALGLLALLALPFLDHAPANEGFGIRRRPLAHAAFAAALFSWAALTIVGAIFRGPEWTFLWPWQGWDPRIAVPMAPRSLGDALGLSGNLATATAVAAVCFWLGMFALGGLWLSRRQLSRAASPRRAWLLAFLLAVFGGLAMKVLLQMVFGIRYVFRIRGFGV